MVHEGMMLLARVSVYKCRYGPDGREPALPSAGRVSAPVVTPVGGVAASSALERLVVALAEGEADAAGQRVDGWRQSSPPGRVALGSERSTTASQSPHAVDGGDGRQVTT